MRMINGMIGAAIAALGIAGSMAFAAPAAEGVRAGDLAVRLARAAGAPRRALASERAAAEYLAARGIVFGSSLDSIVREGDLVRAAEAVGAQVRSSQPSSPATPAQGAAFIGVVRGSLATDAGAGGVQGGQGDDINVSCQGRDARSGRKGTPASPADPNATAPACTGDEPQP